MAFFFFVAKKIDTLSQLRFLLSLLYMAVFAMTSAYHHLIQNKPSGPLFVRDNRVLSFCKCAWIVLVFEQTMLPARIGMTKED